MMPKISRSSIPVECIPFLRFDPIGAMGILVERASCLLSIFASGQDAHSTATKNVGFVDDAPILV